MGLRKSPGPNKAEGRGDWMLRPVFRYRGERRGPGGFSVWLPRQQRGEESGAEFKLKKGNAFRRRDSNSDVGGVTVARG